jgi:hypothetical protein
MKLDSDDDAGIELLERASELDPALAQACAFHVVEYLRRHGRNADARSHMDELAQAAERDERARRERAQVRTSDKLLPHELPPEAVQALVEQLRTFPEVRYAWLVRKQTQYYPDVPLYVLGVCRKSYWWKLESSGAQKRLAQALATNVQYPGETLIICLDGENKHFRSRFKKVPGAKIYSA